MLRSLIRGALKRRGWELKRIGDPVRGYANFIAFLHQRGFQPQTVIDVGVNTGTPWLHGQFHAAKLVLIEPHPDRKTDLLRLAATYDADVYAHAVGAASGELVLHHDPVQPGSSSARTHSALVMNHHARMGRPRTFTDICVPVKTLDETLGDRYSAPYLLKIDTEGFELEVLLGAMRTLEQTVVALVEISVAPRFENGCSVAELLALLEARGFRLFDMPYIHTIGHAGPISYLDAAFIHRSHEHVVGY